MNLKTGILVTLGTVALTISGIMMLHTLANDDLTEHFNNGGKLTCHKHIFFGNDGLKYNLSKEKATIQGETITKGATSITFDISQDCKPVKG